MQAELQILQCMRCTIPIDRIHLLVIQERKKLWRKDTERKAVTAMVKMASFFY